MKGNFPLLSLIKAIFLSLQGSSFNEVRSSLLHLTHQLHGCTTQTLSKQLAQGSAWFTERQCPWRPKRHVCPEVHSVDHIQTKWECLGGILSTCRWPSTISFINVLFLLRRFIDLKGQLPIFGLKTKGNQGYSEEVQAGVFRLNSDSQWASSLALGEPGTVKDSGDKATTGLHLSFLMPRSVQQAELALCGEMPVRSRL